MSKYDFEHYKEDCWLALQQSPFLDATLKAASNNTPIILPPELKAILYYESLKISPQRSTFLEQNKVDVWDNAIINELEHEVLNQEITDLSFSCCTDVASFQGIIDVLISKSTRVKTLSFNKYLHSIAPDRIAVHKAEFIKLMNRIADLLGINENLEILKLKLTDNEEILSKINSSLKTNTRLREFHLEIYDCDNHNPRKVLPELDFPPINQTLQVLTIETDHVNPMIGICRTLPLNIHLERVTLHIPYPQFTIPNEHVKVFHDMLAGSNLTHLRLSNFNFKDSSINCISGLNRNTMLQELILENSSIWNATDIAKQLAKNTILKKLTIQNYGPDFIVELSQSLRVNYILKHLDIQFYGYPRINANSFNSLYEALCHNSTIIDLRVSNGKIDINTAKAISLMLRQNSSLNLFMSSITANAECFIEIFSSLKYNKSLKYLLYLVEENSVMNFEKLCHEVMTVNKTLLDLGYMGDSDNIIKPYLVNNRRLSKSLKNIAAEVYVISKTMNFENIKNRIPMECLDILNIIKEKCRSPWYTRS